jgi:predicted MFS family arabinose efflux permease
MMTVLVGLMGIIPLSRVSYVAVAPTTTTARRSALPPLLPLVVLLACGYLNHSAMSSSRVFYPPYFDLEFGLPTAMIGLITSVGTALAVVAALAGAPFARKYGSPVMMLFAAFALAASLVLMALSPGWVSAAIGVIGGLAVMSVWLPNYQMRLMEMATPEQRSLVAGAGSMAMSLGFASMSFSGGHIAASAGYHQLFLLGAGLAIASAALGWISLRIASRERGVEPSPSRQTADVHS